KTESVFIRYSVRYKKAAATEVTAATCEISEFSFQPQPGFVGIGTGIALAVGRVFQPCGVIFTKAFGRLNIHFTAFIGAAFVSTVIVVKRQQVYPGYGGGHFYASVG